MTWVLEDDRRLYTKTLKLLVNNGALDNKTFAKLESTRLSDLKHSSVSFLTRTAGHRDA